MPRFFFHVRAEGELFADPDGGEFPDLGAARAEAVAAAREVLAEQIRAGKALRVKQIEIWDARGRLWGTVSLRDGLGLGPN